LSDELWKSLMLTPYDYKPDETAIFHRLTREIMGKIEFRHGGSEYDAKYPEGIPTSVRIEIASEASSIQNPKPKIQNPAGGAAGESPALQAHSSFDLRPSLDSGLVMFPAGHARNETADLEGILRHKFQMLGSLALPDGADVGAFTEELGGLGKMSTEQVGAIYDFQLAERPGYE
jgi:2-methylcitrate dehydratase